MVRLLHVKCWSPPKYQSEGMDDEHRYIDINNNSCMNKKSIKTPPPSPVSTHLDQIFKSRRHELPQTRCPTNTHLQHALQSEKVEKNDGVGTIEVDVEVGMMNCLL
jgi:hypothetical protein